MTECYIISISKDSIVTNVVTIKDEEVDHKVKVSPEKCDDNSRCMSDSNGSRMFQGGQNKFGY